MAIRRFAPEQVELAAAWFDLVETADQWCDLGPVGEGESQAFRVCNAAGVRGVAKPGAGAPTQRDVCRAAHEKIAADLAFRLGLPVPPVVLWDRGPGEQSSNRHVAISAQVFERSSNYREVKNHATLVRLCAEPMTAMRVFHAWISAEDRESKNILVNSDSPPERPALAYIDHAFSMSCFLERAE